MNNTKGIVVLADLLWALVQAEDRNWQEVGQMGLGVMKVRRTGLRGCGDFEMLDVYDGDIRGAFWKWLSAAINESDRPVFHRLFLNTKIKDFPFSTLKALPPLKEGKADKDTKRLFDKIELSAFIIPSKTRKESFEPSFEDQKGDYLGKREKYRGRMARRWLAFWFCVHALILFVQCFWALFSEKTKKYLWAAFGGLVMWFRGL